MARKSRRVSRASAARPALPFDVLHSALALLSQPDLRNAAAVSRPFREAAKQAGLYIHRTIKWDLVVDVGPDVEILRAVINRAQEDDCRISLELSYVGLLPWSSAQQDSFYADTRDDAQTLADCISQALPYLVFLRVHVPDYYRTHIDAVLLDPAPHLRTFQIHDYGGESSLRTSPLIRLPADLFAGDAPKLRSVSLEYVPLGPTAISAFSHVEHFRMQFDEVFPDMDVARHFPRLSSLHIAHHHDDKLAQPLTCILRGLALSQLTAEVHEQEERVYAMIADELDLSSIPEIECRISAGMFRTVWTAPLCADEVAELSAHVYQHANCGDNVAINVTARDSEWHCAYIISHWNLQVPHAFFGESMDFVFLSIDNTCMPGLLESGIALPRLRELRINLRPHGEHATMIWPLAWGVTLSPDDGGDARRGYRVPCPVLETLAILALEEPMRVRDTEVVQLSEALGQLKRKDGVRAQLVLHGVSFVSVGLDQMFSTVRSVP